MKTLMIDAERVTDSAGKIVESGLMGHLALPHLVGINRQSFVKDAQQTLGTKQRKPPVQLYIREIFHQRHCGTLHHHIWMG